MRPGIAGALFALVVAAACGDGRRTVHVRTDLPEALRDEVEATFEGAHPSLDVRFSEAAPDETLQALSSGEADFDVWWGAPALALESAARGGRLEAYDPAWHRADLHRWRETDETPAREGDEPPSRPGEAAAPWHPVLSSPLVIAFNRTIVPISEAPTDWIDVFHHGWFGEVRLLDPGRTDAGAWLVGAMIVEALRDDDDLNRGFDWLSRLHDQVDVYAVEPGTLVRALDREQALLVVMPRADAERARTGEDGWLHYRIPASGTPLLLLAVAIRDGTEVPEAARDFVEHLGTDGVATASKLHTHWTPTVGFVDDSALPPDFELEQTLRGYVPAVDTLAVELTGWLERWEREIRIR